MIDRENIVQQRGHEEQSRQQQLDSSAGEGAVDMAFEGAEISMTGPDVAEELMDVSGDLASGVTEGAVEGAGGVASAIGSLLGSLFD